MAEKVLVVDDNVALRELIGEILRAEGLTAITAGDGREGLEEFLRHQPDLVLLDVQMPGLEALKCASESRATQKHD